MTGYSELQPQLQTGPQWWAILAMVVGFGAIGSMIAAASRLLLGRMRRGAVFRPPGCELVAGCLSVVLGWRVATGALPVWWVEVPLLLASAGVPLAVVDLVHRRLPDAFTLPAYPVLGCCLVVASCAGPDGGLWLRALAGTVAFGGAHVAVRWFAPGSLGAGDVKLAGSLGAVLGSVGWAAMAVAAVLAALVTALLAGWRRTKAGPSTRRCGAPHGPGLLIAVWLLATFPGSAFPIIG